MIVQVWEQDTGKDDLLGQCEVKLDEVFASGLTDKKYTLLDPRGKKNSSIRLVMRFEGH